MRNFFRVIRESMLVFGVLPFNQFIRWVLCLVGSVFQVVRQKSLGVVDEKFGHKFEIKTGHKRLTVEDASFGVVREIFGHACYARPEELEEAKHILDLGANCGVFTLFALVHAPNAKIYAVEAQKKLAQIAQANIRRNGFAGRAEVEIALAGGVYNSWARQLCESDPLLHQFPIADYLEKNGFCDFLKCDIEGAEYALFSGKLDWLDHVGRIALEYHGSSGEEKQLRSTLEQRGFKVRQQQHGGLGYLFCSR